MSDETRAGDERTAQGSSPGDRFAAGSEFAGHRIEGELGRGGMGVVYRAHHLALDAARALKVVAPSLSADPLFQERFRRESRIAASIDHPNVVAVHSAGEEDGLLYISMRLVEGSDLKEVVEAQGALEPARGAAVVAGVAAALDASHAAGLVHRDVKPANVLIEPAEGGDRVFLTDFGISRITAGGSTVTSAGELLGSVDYIAPEQIEGGEIGSAADIYSLGCLACFALIGEPPFVREHDLARMYAHANAPRPRLSERSPMLSRSVDSVIERAMSIEPGNRYPSAGQMADELKRALGRDPSEVTTKRTIRPGLIERRRPTRWRVPVAAALLVAAAVAVFLVIGPGGDASNSVNTASIAATISLDGQPEGIAVGNRATWVTSTGRLRSIDLATNKVVDSVPLEGRAPSVAVDFGAVWVAARSSGSVLRLEPRDDKKPVEIPLGGGPSDVLTAYGSVWVATEDNNMVSRIDPTTNRVVDRIRVGNAPRSLAAGDGAIWVANIGGGSITRIEAQSGSIDTKPIEVGESPNDLAFGSGSLWVCDVFSGEVYEIDPESMQVVGDPISVGARPRGIGVGYGSVWVANGADDNVTRIDAATAGTVGDPIPVGTDPADLAVGEGSVWTADSGAGAPGAASVTRIDP